MTHDKPLFIPAYGTQSVQPTRHRQRLVLSLFLPFLAAALQGLYGEYFPYVAFILFYPYPGRADNLPRCPAFTAWQSLSPRTSSPGSPPAWGGKNFSGMMDTWDDANQAMRYWAKRVRYVNCLGSGRSACEKP